MATYTTGDARSDWNTWKNQYGNQYDYQDNQVGFQNYMNWWSKDPAAKNRTFDSYNTTLNKRQAPAASPAPTPPPQTNNTGVTPMSSPLLTKPNAATNPYANQLTQKGDVTSGTALQELGDAYRKHGVGLLDQLVNQQKSALSGDITSNPLSGLLQNYASDQAARSSASNLRGAREAGMSPAELAALRVQGNLSGNDARRMAGIDAENMMVQRINQAQSLYGQLASPMQTLGTTQAQGNDNFLSRLVSQGEGQAARNQNTDTNYLNRLQNMSQIGLGYADPLGQGAASGNILAALGLIDPTQIASAAGTTNSLLNAPATTGGNSTTTQNSLGQIPTFLPAEGGYNMANKGEVSEFIRRLAGGIGSNQPVFM